MAKKKALIVDDSASMRNMVKVVLQNLGFDAVTAQDGKKALRLAENDNVDLVITDINMPNMDGIELIGKLRELDNFKFVPILVLTTEGGSVTKESGKEAGATGWIVKPFDEEIIERAVRKVCNMN